MNRRWQRLLWIALPVLTTGACEKVNFTAPEGTTLTLSANPLTIPVSGGQTTLTALLFKSSGFPVSDGTTVNFTTTLGSVTPQVETRDGIAVAVLSSTGETGVASVFARSGNVESNEVMISIGVPASNVTITATPADLPSGGGTVQLVAVVFGETGGPAQGAAVTFQTTAGTLLSGGSPVFTNNFGEARDSLTTSSTATVTASAGGVNASTDVPVASAEVDSLLLSANPTTLATGGGSSSLVAVVFGPSGPQSGVGVSFRTTAGSLSSTGVVVTNSAGEARNTLTTSESATVTASAGSVSDDITVNVGDDEVFLTLSLSRNSITDTATLPGANYCDSGGSANGQIPVTLFAAVTDGRGNPVANRNVTFFLDFSILDGCARSFGEFCGSGGGQVTATTDANGQATALFGASDADFTFCNDLVMNPQCCENCGSASQRNLFCSAGITVESGQSTDASKSALIEWGS